MGGRLTRTLRVRHPWQEKALFLSFFLSGILGRRGDQRQAGAYVTLSSSAAAAAIRLRVVVVVCTIKKRERRSRVAGGEGGLLLGGRRRSEEENGPENDPYNQVIT